MYQGGIFNEIFLDKNQVDESCVSIISNLKCLIKYYETYQDLSLFFKNSSMY